MKEKQNILEIDHLSKYFGGLAAVQNCSLKIKKPLKSGFFDHIQKFQFNSLAKSSTSPQLVNSYV